MKSGYSDLEHTADAGIRVFAPSLDELFVQAASGLFATIADLSGCRPDRSVHVQLSADSREELLQTWLQDLLVRFGTTGILFSDFSVSIEELRLNAIARGEPFDPARHHFYTEVKGVTYHGLKIEQGQEGFQAEVIFDL